MCRPVSAGNSKDSSLPSSVRNFLKGPEGDRPFTPQVHEKALQTSTNSAKVLRRGYMVARLKDFVPARQLGLDEARDKAVELYRKDKAVEGAKERLEKLLARVTAGDVTLEEGALELGLDVRMLRRFNQSTTEPREPTVPPGEDADEELLRAQQRIRHRNRVQRFYVALRDAVEPGTFMPQVQTDYRTEAAYLLRVVARDEPGPLEMSSQDLAVAKSRLLRSTAGWQNDLLGYKTLAERYQLETNAARRKQEAEEAEEAEKNQGDDT